MRRAALAIALAACGHAAPRATVTPWRPAGISSPQFESHAAFDPRTGDLYVVRSTPQFTGWRIFTSRCGERGWSPPAPPPFASAADDGVEADPYVTPDGRSLYFISTRSDDGVKKQDLDLWRVDRGDDGAWGRPVRLPAPINSSGQEWFPRPAADGWLYFGSDRDGGLGKTDLWRARADGDRWTVEDLGPTVNTAGDEYEPLVSPDGTRLILMADGGLYESRRTAAGGWGPRVKLGPEVNVNGTELGALFSPSGRSLMFARDTKGPASGELFVWRPDGEEAWPPACPHLIR